MMIMIIRWWDDADDDKYLRGVDWFEEEVIEKIKYLLVQILYTIYVYNISHH